MRNTTKRELIRKVRAKYSNLKFGVYRILYVTPDNLVKDIDVLNKLTRRELESLLVNGSKNILDWECAWIITSGQKISETGDVILGDHLVFTPEERFERV